MAIKGSLAEASLPDVIQLLSYSGKSGCLSVTDGRNFGNIFIKDGKVVFATILNRKQKLGDILMTKQLIDKETLTKAYDDFVASSPIAERVFKVHKDAIKPKAEPAKPFIPLATLTGTPG